MINLNESTIDKFLRGVNSIRKIDKKATDRFLRGVNRICEIDRKATNRFLCAINNHFNSVSQILHLL